MDLVLPPRCPGCDREGELLCGSCRAVVRRRLLEPLGTPLGLASAQPSPLVQLEWCSSFTGPARASIHALKYDGERRLARPLGALMAARYRQAMIGGDVLVPVPVHIERRRQRGFDQAEMLAAVIGRELDLPVVAVVRRSAVTAAQHRLGRRERAGNVGGAFSASDALISRVRHRWAVLVDDVVTTGATLGGCGQTLLDAGALAVSGICLARER